MKQTYLQKSILASIYVFMFALFIACGAPEDPNIPNLCALDCNNAKFLPPASSSASYVIEANSSDIKAQCKSPSTRALTNEVLVTFGVRRLGKASEGGGGEGGEEGGGDQGVAVPLSGIKLHFYTQGNAFHRDAATRTKVHKNLTKRDEYSGITTSSNQWCTDVCGTARISLKLSCPLPGVTQNGTLHVESGPFRASINVESKNTQEEEKDETPTTPAQTTGDGDGDGGTTATARNFRFDWWDLWSYYQWYKR